MQLAAQVTLASATEVLSSNLALLLGAPVAVLSRGGLGWRFEGHAFPETHSEGALARLQHPRTVQDPVNQLEKDSGHAWTAISLGTLGERDWALLLPGPIGDLEQPARLRNAR